MKLPRDDVVQIAGAQKMLLWAILTSIAVNLFSIAVNVGFSGPNAPDQATAAILGMVILAAALGVLALQIVSVVRLCLALKEGWATVLYVIFQFAPCINLILLLFLNGRATKRLQDSGIRVGLMGANSRDVASYEPASGRTCSGCGESLEADVAVCPVCGQRQAASPVFGA